MIVIKCLLVLLLCLIAGSRSEHTRADLQKSANGLLAAHVSAAPQLHSDLFNPNINDESPISEADVCMMCLLAAGLVALQLRREQKRAGRARFRALLTFPVMPLEPLSTVHGERQ